MAKLLVVAIGAARDQREQPRQTCRDKRQFRRQDPRAMQVHDPHTGPKGSLFGAKECEKSYYNYCGNEQSDS